MSGDPRGPNLLRGALVSVDPNLPVPKAVVFQYNPDSVTRKLTARSPGDSGGRLTANRLGGAPQETIGLDVEIDATDQLAQSDNLAMSLGIYPQLSMLEMLIYPSSVVVIANTALLALGTIEIMPAAAPLTLLIWGSKRIVPVRLGGFTITEEAHDTALNPIRARVGLELVVLSYEDLSVTNPGYYVFLAHHMTKEAMALVGTATALPGVGTSLTGIS